MLQWGWGGVVGVLFRVREGAGRMGTSVSVMSSLASRIIPTKRTWPRPHRTGEHQHPGARAKR